ncbi:lyase family protein [Psychrobacter aestuarii]|uniref:3-carboxy-cis,cis-muconate cycloisomerase n=1 Tax=Psychrobacter aestuarii TaxID=556327 RepID=A0ABN0VRI7_9GAMM|nr:lyase family protein [Psychrobacter aestuarii]
MKINRLINQPFVHPAVAEDLSDRHFVQAMLDFELAILLVRERNGLIPEGIFAQSKHALALEHFDMDALSHDSYLGGNAAIPFVQQAKAILPTELIPYFHQTVTSQDVVDTAMMLMLKPVMAHIQQDVMDVLGACRQLIHAHRRTPMAGRTLLQQALPITFGVKVAQWAAGLLAVVPQLQQLTQTGFYLQWGGPVGIGDVDNQQHQLPKQVADHLGLAVPLLPWHTNRQPIHAIASSLDACAGAMENIVEDIALMCQSEIGEVSEPAIEGMGGSSSMPHKRNPILCALITAASIRMHGHLSVISNTSAQPFERALGQWHASWVPLTEGAALVAGAVFYLKTLLQGLQVHPARMAANLDLNSDAYLTKPLTRYAKDSDAPALLAMIDKASEDAHQQHQGFVVTLQDLLAAPSDTHANTLSNTQQDALIALTDPLRYCQAAEQQCQAVLDAIDALDVHKDECK